MLAVDPVNGLPVVVLMPWHDPGGDDDPLDAGHRSSELAVTPVLIPVGTAEAAAIATRLDRIELERPPTYQLMCSLLDGAGSRIERVELCDDDDGRFTARIHLLRPGGERVVRHGRTSDALALALYADAEIRVAPGVVDKASLAAFENDWLAAPEPAPELAVDVPDAYAEPGLLYLDPCLESEMSMPRLEKRIDDDAFLVSDKALRKWKM